MCEWDVLKTVSAQAPLYFMVRYRPDGHLTRKSLVKCSSHEYISWWLSLFAWSSTDQYQGARCLTWYHLQKLYVCPSYVKTWVNNLYGAWWQKWTWNSNYFFQYGNRLWLLQCIQVHISCCWIALDCFIIGEFFVIPAETVCQTTFQ